jgi:hypothetical protein
MSRPCAFLGVCLTFACNLTPLYAGMPWEIRARNGTPVWEQAGSEEIPKGETRALRLGYDREGKVLGGNQLWVVDHRGPDTVRIRAVEGKLKGYYLNSGLLGGFSLSQTPEDFILEQKGSGK